MDFVVQCTTNVQWIATMNLIPFITFLIYNKTHMRSIQSEEKQFLGFEILL